MLPKCARLSKEKEIKETIKHKQYEAKAPLLYLLAKDNSLDHCRLAIVTPRKLGKAAFRNRIRRVLAAAFFRIWRSLAKKVDIVAFPKSAMAFAKQIEIESSLRGCLVGWKVK